MRLIAKGKDIAEGIKKSKTELAIMKNSWKMKPLRLPPSPKEKEKLQKELETLPAGTVDLSSQCILVKKSLIGLRVALETL